MTDPGSGGSITDVATCPARWLGLLGAARRQPSPPSSCTSGPIAPTNRTSRSACDWT